MIASVTRRAGAARSRRHRGRHRRRHGLPARGAARRVRAAARRRRSGAAAHRTGGARGRVVAVRLRQRDRARGVPAADGRLRRRPAPGAGDPLGAGAGPHRAGDSRPRPRRAGERLGHRQEEGRADRPRTAATGSTTCRSRPDPATAARPSADAVRALVTLGYTRRGGGNCRARGARRRDVTQDTAALVRRALSELARK